MNNNPLRVSLDNIIPLTEARDHFSQIVNEVQKDKLYVLTKGGKPAVAIVDVKYLEHISGGHVNTNHVEAEIKKNPTKVGRPEMISHNTPKPASPFSSNPPTNQTNLPSSQPTNNQSIPATNTSSSSPWQPKPNFGSSNNQPSPAMPKPFSPYQPSNKPTPPPVTPKPAASFGQPFSPVSQNDQAAKSPSSNFGGSLVMPGSSNNQSQNQQSSPSFTSQSPSNNQDKTLQMPSSNSNSQPSATINVQMAPDFDDVQKSERNSADLTAPDDKAGPAQYGAAQNEPADMVID